MRISFQPRWDCACAEAVIFINLLPPDHRKEEGLRYSFLKSKRFLNGIGAMFLILTSFLYVRYQWESVKFRELQTQWASLEKEAQRAAQLKIEIEQGVKQERNFLQDYVINPLSTTSLLSAVNVLLPSSVWLLELKVSRQAHENTLMVKGLSLPALRGASIQDIEKYLGSLKERLPPRTELILTTSRQVKENHELTLFTAVFKWT